MTILKSAAKVMTASLALAATLMFGACALPSAGCCPCQVIGIESAQAAATHYASTGNKRWVSNGSKITYASRKKITIKGTVYYDDRGQVYSKKHTFKLAKKCFTWDCDSWWTVKEGRKHKESMRVAINKLKHNEFISLHLYLKHGKVYAIGFGA